MFFIFSVPRIYFRSAQHLPPLERWRYSIENIWFCPFFPCWGVFSSRDFVASQDRLEARWTIGAGMSHVRLIVRFMLESLKGCSIAKSTQRTDSVTYAVSRYVAVVQHGPAIFTVETTREPGLSRPKVDPFSNNTDVLLSTDCRQCLLSFIEH